MAETGTMRCLGLRRREQDASARKDGIVSQTGRIEYMGAARLRAPAVRLRTTPLLGHVLKAGLPKRRPEPGSTAAKNAREAATRARIREIRGQIAAGTYLTHGKLELVVDCLCDVLNEGHGRIRRATA